MEYIDLVAATLAEFVEAMEIKRDEYGTVFLVFEELEGYGGPVAIAIGYGEEGVDDLINALDYAPEFV